VVGPFHNGFLAIEKDKLQRVFEFQSRRRARKFQQPCRAGASVACADESKIVEELRIVVTCDRDSGGFRTGTRSPDIHHVPEAAWCPRVEFVKLRLQSRLAQLRNEVVPRFCYRFASSRT